jgi:GGDEF domain-containing protein
LWANKKRKSIGNVKFFDSPADKRISARHMISLLKPMNDLDRCQQTRELALDCYLAAIRNIAHYAVELEPQTTAQHRKYLEDLAEQVSTGASEALNDSRATVRGLLRDYRDYTSRYLNGLRQELSNAVTALESTLGELAQCDGDHGVQLRNAVVRLRAIPTEAASTVRETVLAAASTIESSLEEMRKQHQLTVAQFVIEIGILHKRIDALESAASIDMLTQLFNREEMEERISGMRPAKMTILLLKTGGLRAAETRFGRGVAEELTGAFAKRLHNSLPSTAVIGRWSEERFLAILQADQPETAALATRISEGLAGAYACLKEGKTVRPVIHLRIGLVAPGKDDAARVLQRVGEFLNGA